MCRLKGLQKKAREIIEILKEQGLSGRSGSRWVGNSDDKKQRRCRSYPLFVRTETFHDEKQFTAATFTSTQQNGIDFWTIYKQEEDNG